MQINTGSSRVSICIDGLSVMVLSCVVRAEFMYKVVANKKDSNVTIDT